VIHITWFWHGYKVEIFLKNSWNCVVRLIFFTKTCLTNNLFSRDPLFVILRWVQSWNNFEKLMKLWSPPEFFHKSKSHEQLAVMWSTFRDSSMGTMLKYFWKIHESLQSAWIFSEKHVSRTINFHVIHISWFYNWYKIEILFEKFMKLWSEPEFIHKIMSHEQLPFMWSTFLDSSMGTSWIIFEKLMKVCSPPEFGLECDPNLS